MADFDEDKTVEIHDYLKSTFPQYDVVLHSSKVYILIQYSSRTVKVHIGKPSYEMYYNIYITEELISMNKRISLGIYLTYDTYKDEIAKSLKLTLNDNGGEFVEIYEMYEKTIKIPKIYSEYLSCAEDGYLLCSDLHVNYLMLNKISKGDEVDVNGIAELVEFYETMNKLEISKFLCYPNLISDVELDKFQDEITDAIEADTARIHIPEIIIDIDTTVGIDIIKSRTSSKSMTILSSTILNNYPELIFHLTDCEIEYAYEYLKTVELTLFILKENRFTSNICSRICKKALAEEEIMEESKKNDTFLRMVYEHATNEY